MNVYEVITRIVDLEYEGDGVRTVRQSECILAKNLHEVAEMVKNDSDVLAINHICTIPGRSNQKYIAVPADEDDWSSAVERAERSEMVDDAVGILKDAKELVAAEKHHLVQTRDYESAQRLREAEKMLRTLLDEPTSLEDLFVRQKVTDKITELEDLTRRLLARVNGGSDDGSDA